MNRLIQLLIVSQLFKTLWIWTFSIRQLSRNLDPSANGGVPSPPNKGFCTADGFLYAYGSEATGTFINIFADSQLTSVDFVILLIAIHTVMSIFSHRRTTDQSGLYPYRHIAYAGWIIYPTLMASLAFTNGSNAYISQGSLCFLPIRPFWYRLALSWIPRYLILTFILGVYAAVYLYVRYKFNDLSNRMGDGTGSNSSDLLTNGARASITTTLGRAALPAPTDPNAGLTARHRAIRKQLRYMFIYPVVYLLFWIIPFVNHCFGYTQTRSPFVVTTLAFVSLTLQCAADCIVFAMREKPWRHNKPVRRPSWSLPTFLRKGSTTSEKHALPILTVDVRHNQEPSNVNWWDVETAATCDGSAEARVAMFMEDRYPV